MSASPRISIVIPSRTGLEMPSLDLLIRGRALVAVAILLVVLPAFFPEQVTDRMSTILRIFSDDPPPSWTARVNAWQKFGGLVMKSPLIGRGVASDPLGYIDNEYMKQANELGLIGLCVFFWLLIRIFQTALETVRLAKDREVMGYCMGFTAGFAAILIHNLGATSLTSIRIAEPFFFATGLLYAARNHLVERPSTGDDEWREEDDGREEEEASGPEALAPGPAAVERAPW